MKKKGFLTLLDHIPGPYLIIYAQKIYFILLFYQDKTKYDECLCSFEQTNFNQKTVTATHQSII